MGALRRVPAAAGVHPAWGAAVGQARRRSGLPGAGCAPLGCSESQVLVKKVEEAAGGDARPSSCSLRCPKEASSSTLPAASPAPSRSSPGGLPGGGG